MKEKFHSLKFLDYIDEKVIQQVPPSLKARAYRIWQDEDQPLFRRAIYKMLFFGKPPVFLIVGDTRLGKSMMGLDIAQEIQPDFKIKEGAFFNEKQFMQSYIQSKDGVGKTFIIDEGQRKLAVNNMYDPFNDAIGAILSTQAMFMKPLIMVMPVAKALLPQHRFYVHFLIEAQYPKHAIIYGLRVRYSELYKQKVILKEVLHWDFQFRDIHPYDVKEYRTKERRDKKDILKEVYDNVMHNGEKKENNLGIPDQI